MLKINKTLRHIDNGNGSLLKMNESSTIQWVKVELRTNSENCLVDGELPAVIRCCGAEICIALERWKRKYASIWKQYEVNIERCRYKG